MLTRLMGHLPCLQAMAHVEMRAALALLLARFSFRLAPESGGAADVLRRVKKAMTLHVEGGVRMNLTPRAMDAR